MVVGRYHVVYPAVAFESQVTAIEFVLREYWRCVTPEASLPAFTFGISRKETILWTRCKAHGKIHQKSRKSWR
jgi:hypothetical protein